MTYQDFRNTYKNLLKKYCWISNIFEAGYIIEMTETRYKKIGSRWKETESNTKNVDYEIYCNVFDAVQFFRNLGGYEKVTCGYTIAGYIPTENISISPDRTTKVTRKFFIHR